MKVSIIIPCTSKNHDNWSNVKDSYLYNMTLKTFLLTMDKEHEYCFYIGYDDYDRIYSKKECHDEIKRFSIIFKNVSFSFIKFNNIKKGHLTKMWNILFKEAYNDNYDYFYQTGDDIVFKSKGWVNETIKILQKNNNIGLSGPINNNNRILTQAMVSRKHMDIFGYFFPEEIINWCCDDWYNFLYHPDHFYPLKDFMCSNDGGPPRYVINNNINFMNQTKYIDNVSKLREFAMKLATRDKKKLKKYIEDNKN